MNLDAHCGRFLAEPTRAHWDSLHSLCTQLENGFGPGMARGWFDAPPENPTLLAAAARVLAFTGYPPYLVQFDFDAWQRAGELPQASVLARALNAFSAIRADDAPGARTAGRAAMHTWCKRSVAGLVLQLQNHPQAIEMLLQATHDSTDTACGNQPAFNAFVALNSVPFWIALAQGKLPEALAAARSAQAAQHIEMAVATRISELNAAGVIPIGAETQVEFANCVAAEVARRLHMAPGGPRLLATLARAWDVPFNATVLRALDDAFLNTLTAQVRGILSNPPNHQTTDALFTIRETTLPWRQALLAQADSLFLPAGAEPGRALLQEQAPHVPSEALRLAARALADPSHLVNDEMTGFRSEKTLGNPVALVDLIGATHARLELAFARSLSNAVAAGELDLSHGEHSREQVQKILLQVQTEAGLRNPFHPCAAISRVPASLYRGKKTGPHPRWMPAPAPAVRLSSATPASPAPRRPLEAPTPRTRAAKRGRETAHTEETPRGKTPCAGAHQSPGQRGKGSAARHLPM